MLDFCPTSRAHSQGFTLLEILVVLLFLGLVGSLLVPRLGGLYDSLVLREQRQAILSAVDARRYEAITRGESFVLGAGPVQSLLPEVQLDGWALSVDRDLVVRPNGVCLGGVVVLRYADTKSWAYRFEPPYCHPKQVDENT